jgi:cyclophilin family peptidyl-prolyl cis-trans isomerase
VSRSAAALLACLALALPACGGGGDDEPEPPEETVAALDGNGCTPAEQPAPKPEQANEPDGELDPDTTYIATVKTNCGTFEITLDAERAPKTGASFKSLADQRFYDRTTIHRLVYGFVIQGGDPRGDGEGGPGYTVVEPPPDDLVYEPGIVAMAKTPDEKAGSSGSQFFVVSGPDARNLPPEYALLGRISGGQQVIDKLGAIITDPRTERPEDPIVIESIRVSQS